MIKDLILKNRSYRRFYQDITVDIETLRELVSLARLSPSARNLQPLKYFLSSDREKNDLIFRHLAWAGYLTDWAGPEEGERPGAYIIILGDTELTRNFGVDHGIAAQNILLGAAEKGLGGCMVGSVERNELRRVLEIPEVYEILLVLAIGRPKETVVIKDVGTEGEIKYWRDEAGVHHVPKRNLDDLIIDSVHDRCLFKK